MNTKLLLVISFFTTSFLLAQQQVPFISLNSNDVKFYNSIETLIAEEFPMDFAAYSTADLIQRSINNGCPTGDVIITSQAEINALSGCTEIPGDLVIIGTNIIDGDNTITDLSPLNDLTNITGDIEIGGLPEVTTLPTFESLTSINGDYRIYSMPLLTSLPNVPNQAILVGDIQFSLLPQVTTLPPGLSNSVSTTGYINISNLSSITTIPSLNNLQTVGDYMSFTALSIANLPNLENLTSVGSFFNGIGLSQITQINLPALVTVGNALNIQNNAALTDINAPLLQTAGQVLIAGNTSMTQINGFPSLIEITSRLGIAAQNNITNVSAFSNLQTIGFFLLQSTNLTNVDFLSNVTGMTTGFQIVVNADLTNLNGLNNVEIIEGLATDFGKTISISSCPSLTTLGTMDLTSNNHFTSISIQGLPSPQNLTNLSALSGISGEIGVIFLRSLGITDLNFLSNVNKVMINFTVVDNNSLNDINGISGLDVSDLQSFSLSNNSLLDNCTVASVCNAINLNNTNGLPTISIVNNNTNCDSKATVETACQSLSVSDFIGIDINASPNPFTNAINIQLPVGVDKASVKIMNVEGKVVVSQTVSPNNNSVNGLESLQNGLYLLQMSFENGQTFIKKIIK